jgi:hypothetical protein
MTTKHTPAPWRISKSPSTGEYTISHGKPDGKGYFVIIAGICRCYDSDIDENLSIEEANAKLISAAPDFLVGGTQLNEIIKKAQAILCRYLIPDGLYEDEALEQLVELFDCHEQHEAQENWNAAVAKSTQ